MLTQKEQRSLKEEEVLRVKHDRDDRSHLDSEMYMGGVQRGGPGGGSLVTSKKPVSVHRGDGGRRGSMCSSSGEKKGR